ncbi:MAG: hypothetical protein V7K71_01815 [Nostoc sp.]
MPNSILVILSFPKRVNPAEIAGLTCEISPNSYHLTAAAIRISWINYSGFYKMLKILFST